MVDPLLLTTTASTLGILTGGELLYLNKPVSTRQDLSKIALSSTGAELESIYPRPNRLALIYPGCAHRVIPVSERAGDRYRAAWTGFAF